MQTGEMNGAAGFSFKGTWVGWELQLSSSWVLPDNNKHYHGGSQHGKLNADTPPPFEKGWPHILCNQGELELLIFLPPSPKFWDYRPLTSGLVYLVLRIEFRAL